MVSTFLTQARTISKVFGHSHATFMVHMNFQMFLAKMAKLLAKQHEITASKYALLQCYKT